MDLSAAFPVFLGIFSAVTLAIVNTAVKRGGDVLTARIILSASSAVLMAPFVFLVPWPDEATWWALAIAVPVHFGYQACMIRALHRGDLSLVFPVMRGFAPILTAASAWLVLGEALSPIAVAGLFIATGAVVYFARPPEGFFGPGLHPDGAALFWAFATALGVAAYSVADARGIRLANDRFTYIVWLFVLDWVGVTSVGVLSRGSALLPALMGQWRYGLVGGVGSIFSFGAALYAMSLIEVARVSALRESAVVFAALFGWLYLKEGLGQSRTIAAVILAIGLVLMQTPA
ncbi:MAG: DMT family transporter [Pseudomonadota bacterium]